MNPTHDLYKLDLSYLGAFSTRLDTPWGALFYNENQPRYYDANHAHVIRECHDPQAMVGEVMSFYQKKNLVPRLYIHELHLQQPLLSELEKNQFQYEEFGSKETITKVFMEQFAHPSFSYYLLRLNGEACSTACLFQDGLDARLESVATLESHRGKGLIGHLIRFIQEESSRRDVANLWVLPINEAVEKVYARYGFTTVERMRSGHAFLSGKSIKDIREGNQ
ncbi:GNAT family N-acetyltransferase [Rossellomorea marisflavi]|uniref:GNAT family N-acetyltransferase n=1 Tax=Rossellomorea marisflavi TaxID=189381 RepID=UPI00207AA59F|nr:GNAT family N-acetyltransferase [Rossellomorea marisflavi]USK92949.1 GNAT family N-acetyltransferase [Rossellomorea marisflavi]